MTVTPQNIGPNKCDCCKELRHVLALGACRVCSHCTRKLVAGWAMLASMYPEVGARLLAEANTPLTEDVQP
jgi:hypothetical protein